MEFILALALMALVFLILGFFGMQSDYHDGLNFAGFIMIIVAIGLAITCSILGYSWAAAEHKTKIINREYKTSYTAEEIFWASDVIEQIRELNRQRVQVRGELQINPEDK